MPRKPQVKSCYNVLKNWFSVNPKSLLDRNTAIKMFTEYTAGNIESNLCKLVREGHIRRVFQGYVKR
jgi:hypothetical protein